MMVIKRNEQRGHYLFWLNKSPQIFSDLKSTVFGRSNKGGNKMVKDEEKGVTDWSRLFLS